MPVIATTCKEKSYFYVMKEFASYRPINSLKEEHILAAHAFPANRESVIKIIAA
jgi:hypothetical protein